MRGILTIVLAGFISLPLYANNIDKDELEAQIAALEPKQLTSVIVSQHNALLFEQYYNGAQTDDRQNIRSASKSLTGLMFGRAIADGHFTSENDTVLASFPERTDLLFPSDEKSAMTFFDLLSMTNPLECDDMNNFSAGHEERMYLQKDWVGFFLNLPTRANPPWEPRMEEQPFGRDFAYCTAGISITAAAIERATKTTFAQYIQVALFDKLGIKETVWPYSAEGITQGGGGLSIRPIDLLKIGHLVLNKGSWNGEQLIPESWIAKSLQSYSVAMPELNATYGLTWWHFPYSVNDQTVDAYAAAGNGGNYLFVVPEHHIATVITATAYNTRYMHTQAQGIFSTIVLPALVH